MCSDCCIYCIYSCSGEYTASLRQQPNDPLLHLLIGIAYLHLACQKFSSKRHLLVTQVRLAFAFVTASKLDTFSLRNISHIFLSLYFACQLMWTVVEMQAEFILHFSYLSCQALWFSCGNTVPASATAGESVGSRRTPGRLATSRPLKKYSWTWWGVMLQPLLAMW